MLQWIYEKLLSWHVYCSFMAIFMPKNKNGLFLIFFAQTRLIWNNLSSITKNSHIGHFSHSVFITEFEFLIKNDFQSKMLDLKIHHLLAWSISRWIFNSNIFDWKSFLIKNRLGLTDSDKWYKSTHAKCHIYQSFATFLRGNFLIRVLGEALVDVDNC